MLCVKYGYNTEWKRWVEYLGDKFYREFGGQIGWKMGKKKVVNNFCEQTAFTNWVIKIVGKIVWKKFVKK